MKTYKLQFAKADNPVNYDELKKLRSYSNMKINVVSNTQLIKRLERGVFNEIIDDLENEINVQLND